MLLDIFLRAAHVAEVLGRRVEADSRLGLHRERKMATTIVHWGYTGMLEKASKVAGAARERARLCCGDLTSR